MFAPAKDGAMDLMDLRYLSAAVEAGSLSNAAEALGVKLSEIGRRVVRLEDGLGVTLLGRGEFGVRLTEAGRRVMAPVRRTLDDIDNVLQVGKSSGAGMAGHVRLGVRMPPVGETLRVPAGGLAATSIDVVLTLHRLNDHKCLRAGGAHIGCRARDDACAAAWRNSIPIYREPLWVALPRRHPCLL